MIWTFLSKSLFVFKLISSSAFLSTLNKLIITFCYVPKSWIIKDRLLINLRNCTSYKRCRLLCYLNVIINFDVWKFILKLFKVILCWKYTFWSIDWIGKSCTYGLFWINSDQLYWMSSWFKNNTSRFFRRVSQFFDIWLLAFLTIWLCSNVFTKLWIYFLENTWWIIVIRWINVTLFTFWTFIKEFLWRIFAWLTTISRIVEHIRISRWKRYVVRSILIVSGTCIRTSAFTSIIFLRNFVFLFDDSVRSNSNFKILFIIIFVQRVAYCNWLVFNTSLSLIYW